MTANDMQVGGRHYAKSPYQHWDFVCDTGLHYLLGCATKYVARWKDKGGKEDLEKAMHYLEKARERGVCAPTAHFHKARTEKFCGFVEEAEAGIIATIMDNRFPLAIKQIKMLVARDS